MVLFTRVERLNRQNNSSLQRDLVHVLRAIFEGLDDELQWPGMDCRAKLIPWYISGLPWSWRC